MYVKPLFSAYFAVNLEMWFLEKALQYTVVNDIKCVITLFRALYPQSLLLRFLESDRQCRGGGDKLFTERNYVSLYVHIEVQFLDLFARRVDVDDVHFASASHFHQHGFVAPSIQ
jgi:hypothetical protein